MEHWRLCTASVCLDYVVCEVSWFSLSFLSSNLPHLVKMGLAYSLYPRSLANSLPTGSCLLFNSWIGTWRNPGWARRSGAVLSNSLTWSLSIYDIICVTQRYAEIKSNCSQNGLTRWILNIHEVETTKTKTADCSNLVLYNLFIRWTLIIQTRDWRLHGQYKLLVLLIRFQVRSDRFHTLASLAATGTEKRFLL